MEWSVLADFQIILEVQFSLKMHWYALITGHWNRFLTGSKWLILVVQFQLSKCLFQSQSISELHPRLSRWIGVGLYWVMCYHKHMDQTKAYIMSMGGCYKSNNFIFIMAISFESLHLHDLDLSEMVTWIHPGCQTEDQGDGELYHLHLWNNTYHKDISYCSTMRGQRSNAASTFFTPEPVRSSIHIPCPAAWITR